MITGGNAAQVEVAVFMCIGRSSFHDIFGDDPQQEGPAVPSFRGTLQPRSFYSRGDQIVPL
jgi:hypothetical protein